MSFTSKSELAIKRGMAFLKKHGYTKKNMPSMDKLPKKIQLEFNKIIGERNKAKGGMQDFGMLSVKYGVDNNPNPTQADRIAGATKGKKPKTADAVTGEFIVRGMGAAIRGGKTKGSI